MANEDFWAGLGAVISTILSGIFWFWNIGILQVLFSVLTGALITFFVQSRLQDRAEKRRLRIKYIEDFHIPLFLEIENIKEKFLKNLITDGFYGWTLTKRPEMFTLELEFRQQLEGFLEKTQKINENLNAVRRVVAEIFFRNLQKQLLHSLEELGLLHIQENTEIVVERRRGEGSGFDILLENPIGTTYAPITDCAILKINPFRLLKERHEKFEAEKTFLYVRGHYVQDGIYGTETNDFMVKHPITEHDTFFMNYWEKVVEEVHKNADVNRFNSIRQELIPIADDILKKLKKHIERYVTIEKMNK